MDAHYADIWHMIALQVPDRPAIITTEGDVWTFGDFDEAGARAARMLLDHGIAEGEKLGILLHNRPNGSLLCTLR